MTSDTAFTVPLFDEFLQPCTGLSELSREVGVRIVIVGGGPGGLYLAALLRRSDPPHDVFLLERNRADDAYGFGVVFSDNTLSALEDADPGTTAALSRLGPSWDPIEIRLRDEVVRCGGIGFTAIARRALLEYLHHQAAAAGAALRFETEVAGRGDLPEHDLLVAADGLHSLVRSWYARELGFAEHLGDARFIWLGTDLLYAGLTFAFVQTEHGRFGLHGYPYSHAASTFLVETDERTWHRAGFDAFDPEAAAPGDNDDASVAYLRHAFAGHLDGYPLIGNGSYWRRFQTVTCDRWWHDPGGAPIVLVGDAAHTAHFSVGSGTRMAMEDALALSQALVGHDLHAALGAYEAQRQPEVGRIQAAAGPSQHWWEHFGDSMDEPIERFAFRFLTRSPRITRDSLARRDPAFVARVERWWSANHADPLPDDDLARTAVLAGHEPAPATGRFT